MHRLVGSQNRNGARGDALADPADRAAWEAIGRALLRVLARQDSFGLEPAARDALDVELVRAALVAAQGQRLAFEAGMRQGAALGGMTSRPAGQTESPAIGASG